MVMSTRLATLEIRAAVASERQQALEITLSAYAEYERVLRPEYWDSYRQHIVDTLTDLGAAEQLVAAAGASLHGASLHGASLLGTALFCRPGSSFGEEVTDAAMSLDCPEVRLVAVAPESRGQGVGRAIMEACVDRARASGAPGLVLHTMAIMKAARSLYDSMGFVRAPELDFQPAKEWFVEGFRLDFEL